MISLKFSDKKKIYDQFGYEAVSEQCEGFTSPMDLFQSLFNVDFTNQMKSLLNDGKEMATFDDAIGVNLIMNKILNHENNIR